MTRTSRRAMIKTLDTQFAEMYWKCMNAEEGCAMSFVALSGDKITVMNGRRLVIAAKGAN